MAKGQEESDDLVVPDDRRKAVVTARNARRGKVVTASEMVEQLELLCGGGDLEVADPQFVGAEAAAQVEGAAAAVLDMERVDGHAVGRQAHRRAAVPVA